MEAVVGVIWTQKVAAVGLGLVFIIAGGVFIRVGATAISALNRLNARLPGTVVYPAWYHRFFGVVLVVFGLLIAVVGGILAGR